MTHSTTIPHTAISSNAFILAFFVGRYLYFCYPAHAWTTFSECLFVRVAHALVALFRLSFHLQFLKCYRQQCNIIMAAPQSHTESEGGMGDWGRQGQRTCSPRRFTLQPGRHSYNLQVQHCARQ